MPTWKGLILAISLTVTNIEAGYGRVGVLRGVSLSVGAGETVALLGANGNGKSTLLKCIAGLLRPSTGEIWLDVDGERIDLTTKRVEEIVDLGVALVPEGRRLFDQCFDTFPVLAARRNQLAGNMSGGEQQMLALSRALMSCPRLLIVDEPSVGLSPQMVSRTIAKIKELKERYGLTVLMAEQNFKQAVKIVDRGSIIVHGRIEFEAASAEALMESELVKRFYLGA
jgi:branched-chain amino acid transport system ATP-binding protein